MKLKLLKAHTHAGIDYPAGAIIEIEDLDTATGDWLFDQGVAEPVEAEPAE